MLIKLISIYILIATGTAYAQEPVVIKVGRNQSDTMATNASDLNQKNGRIYFSQGFNISSDSYKNEEEIINISRWYPKIGFALFKENRSSASFTIDLGFTPVSKPITKNEMRLTTSFRLNSSHLPLVRKLNKLPGRSNNGDGLAIELGVNRIQFQDELAVQAKSYIFTGVNWNSLLGPYSKSILKNVIVSLSVLYNFTRKPLTNFQVNNGVSISAGIGYSLN